MGQFIKLGNELIRFLSVKNLLAITMVFYITSCTNNPNGLYEGEIGKNTIVLDFTMDNIVIVKEVSTSIWKKSKIYNRYAHLEKTKCHWIKNGKVLSIYNEQHDLIYSFRINNEDLIDRSSGERLTKRANF